MNFLPGNSNTVSERLGDPYINARLKNGRLFKDKPEKPSAAEP